MIKNTNRTWLRATGPQIGSSIANTGDPKPLPGANPPPLDTNIVKDNDLSVTSMPFSSTAPGITATATTAATTTATTSEPAVTKTSCGCSGGSGSTCMKKKLMAAGIGLLVGVVATYLIVK